VEAYIQLQQVLEELSSAQLIIQMLKKESALEHATTTSNQLDECEQYTAEDWEVKSTKGKKGSLEGKMIIRNKEGIRSNNVTIEMRNRYSVPATDDEIQESENETNICENLLRITTSMPKTNTYQNKQECINTVSPHKELRKRDVTRPNLQSKSITPRQYNTKGTNETYAIPTIINGRIPRKVVTMTSDQRPSVLRERKPNTHKRYTTRTHTKHNLLLLGDSHTRGLAERIGCSLGNSFKVIGITKPNADINRITSPRHYSPASVTKHDAIIFCGGTRDISRNESNSGLRSLKEFAQRTNNTNVILLDVPFRYDLPLSSCVNIEVKFFNKRMRSLMTPFSHVRVVSTSRERTPYQTWSKPKQKRETLGCRQLSGGNQELIFST
jgi:hypothetical protein